MPIGMDYDTKRYVPSVAEVSLQMLHSGAEAWRDRKSRGIQVGRCGADATVLVHREGADPVGHIQGPCARKLQAELLQFALLQEVHNRVVALCLQCVSQYGAKEIALGHLKGKPYMI